MALLLALAALAVVAIVGVVLVVLGVGLIGYVVIFASIPVALGVWITQSDRRG